MATRRAEIARWWWVVLAAWLVIGAAAPRVMAQSCCRCDIGGNPSSCNTGIPDQAICEEVCAKLSSTFGSFQNTCPPGTEFGGCTPPDDPAFCDIICAASAPASVSVPAMSAGGTLVGLGVLVAFGGYRLARRRALPQ
jgi:hypothetical protein